VRERGPAHGGDDASQQPRWDARDRALRAQHPVELPPVPVAEGAVARERLLAGRAPVDDSLQLTPARDPEVPRGADALRGQRDAVPCRVTGEEDLVVDRGADLVRDPVALVADRVLAELGRQPDGRLLHVVARVE
jgi:hypothetical protein